MTFIKVTFKESFALTYLNPLGPLGLTKKMFAGGGPRCLQKLSLKAEPMLNPIVMMTIVNARPAMASTMVDAQPAMALSIALP